MHARAVPAPHISRCCVVGAIATQEGSPSMEPVNAAIIYYSATGTVHALAQAGLG